MHRSQIHFFCAAVFCSDWTENAVYALKVMHFDCELWLQHSAQHWSAVLYFDFCNLVFTSFADLLHRAGKTSSLYCRDVIHPSILFCDELMSHPQLCALYLFCKLNGTTCNCSLSSICHQLQFQLVWFAVLQLPAIVLNQCNCATWRYGAHNQMQFGGNPFLFSLSTACYALTIFDLFVIGSKGSKTSSNSINQSLHLLLLAAASIQQAAKNFCILDANFHKERLQLLLWSHPDLF